MDIPILSKRRAAARKAIEAEAMGKALVAVDQALVETGAIEKSFLTGNAATMMSRAGQSQPKQPGTSWSNQGSTSNRLIARVTQNLSEGFKRAPEELELALAEQGLSWGPPFPPGRPLDPFFGYRRPARTYDYTVGENVQLTPRWNRISFPTIKAIYEAYDVAQICVRHLINDVRSLEYNWEPIKGVKDDVSADIEQAIAFFDSPDKRQPFRTWLAEYLQDVLRYDAGSLYIRRNEAGEPIALEIVSGPTIIPLVDFYGRRPEDEDDATDIGPEGLFGGEIVPAYVQIIEGLPWDWLASDDLLYLPWNPLPDSQYGLAPLEAVLLSANTDIRFQWHFLQFFTEGTLPAGFMEAPPDQSDPAQIASWQETWDAVMQGDQTKLRQVRWVPNGSKFTDAKPDANKFDEKFPLYLARRTMAAFGVTPNDLGFTEDVNRATGDTQVDVQFRVGTSPLLRYVEDVINLFVKQHLKLRCKIHFDDGKETEDRVATAQAAGIYLDHGVIGVDEVRQDLGLHIDKSRPMPRYINNTRAGPIPLLALESMAGEIDPETYGPSDAQSLIDTPYIAPPGVIPVTGTPEEKSAHESTASLANTLRGDTPDEDTGPGADDEEPPSALYTGSISDALKAIDDALAVISKAPDNTGGPGVKGPATTINGGTDGITVATGVQGVELEDDDDDDEDKAVKAAQVALSLRRWRDNSRSRLRKGRPPRKFVDPTLPQDVYDEVWTKLRKASTRQEVDAAFAAVGKAKAGSKPAKRTTKGTPGFHRHTQEIVDYYTPLIAKALGSTLSTADIKAAVKAAAAKKESLSAPPNLRVSSNPAKCCATCKMFDDGKCWGYGNWPVEPEQTCDSWAAGVKKEAQPEPQKSAFDSSTLAEILTHLRGDARLQGALEAAVAAGANVVSDLQCVVNQLPSNYWDSWKPGFGEAAARELERGADERIQGLTDTSLERLTNTIADGLAKGDSVDTVARLAAEDLGSVSRAEMIVNTEYASAMTEANLETYKEAGVEKLSWLAEGDACPECEENADASPIAADDEWPNGDVPVHPNCRCAIAPVSELDDAEKSVVIKGDLQSIVDGLYEDKACSIVKPSLPPGATGELPKAVLNDTKVEEIFGHGEADVAALEGRGIADEAGHIETVPVRALEPTQSHLKSSVIEHAKAHPEKHPITGIKDPFTGKVYVTNGHHGVAAALKDGKAEVKVKITRQVSSPPPITTELHDLKVPEARPQDVLPVTNSKVGDLVHFNGGLDPKTGNIIPSGKGYVARINKDGEMIVNAGTKTKPIWVQTKQRNLFVPAKKAPIENLLGRKGYRARLTPGEQNALDEYKANGYRQLNSGLRSGKPLGTTLQVRADAIDHAIEKGTLSKDTTLYRAFRPEGGMNLNVGDVIQDKAFISTSASTKTPLEIVDAHKLKSAPFYLARIKGPAGTHVAYADAAGVRAAGLSREDEIILPRGTSFRVTKVTTDKYGRREIELEIIGVVKAVGRILVVTEDTSTIASTISEEP